MTPGEEGEKGVGPLAATPLLAASAYSLELHLCV